MSETQSTELVHVQPSNGEVVRSYQGSVDTGLDNVSRIKPTNIILVQGMTRNPMGARPGQLLDTDTGEIFDSLTLVALKIWRPRVLFPPGADLDAEPLCRSNDGFVPSDFAKVKQSSQCGYMAGKRYIATCPQAIWKDGEKPACRQNMKFIAINRKTYLPCFFQVSGKSISSLQTTLDEIARHRDLYKRQHGVQLDLFDYALTITGEKAPDRRYNYYVARFKADLVINPGEFGPYFEEFVANYNAASEQDQDATDEAIDVAVTTPAEPTNHIEV
jgi:hypothetical protein